MMRFDDIESLLGAYALNAVDDDERAVVEGYLTTHPRARAEVAAHQEVATLLALTGAAAPPGLWDRIAASISEEAPPEPGPELAKILPLPASTPGRAPQQLERGDARPDGAVPPPPTRIAAWRRPLAAAAAVAAVAAAVIVPLGLTVRDQDRELDKSALVQLYEDAQSAPGTRAVELASDDGALRVRAVVGADGSGYLEGDDLPPLGEQSTYQLWAILPDRVVSLGVLGADPSLTPFRSDLAAGETATLAVTAERAGGVPLPETQPVAAATLA